MTKDIFGANIPEQQEVNPFGESFMGTEKVSTENFINQKQEEIATQMADEFHKTQEDIVMNVTRASKAFDPNIPQSPGITTMIEDKKEETVSVSANTLSEIAQGFSALIKVLERQNANNYQKTPQPVIDYGKFSQSLAAALKESKESFTTNGALYTEEEIDPADYLENPEVFFCFGYYSCVLDDIRFGKTMKVPYFPIDFKCLYRYPDPTKKGATISISIAIVRLKKQADFMLNHSLLGISIFRKLDTKNIVSLSEQEKIVDAFNRVNMMSENQVKQQCLQYNIPIDTDNFQELRKRLAQKLSEKNMQAEEALYRQSITNVVDENYANPDIENKFFGKLSTTK